ncbi:hypothetical protein CBM2586_A120083 [Cupriavidus phytorum]|uniref:Uncharacterized protein n=1 Tax=Cupriavidus taiwanensis TaxID=164546 RepID=A0A375C1M9_9BURK|nr:hypothetical protein CBM2586_A120083 [Cupriavidus taiwanensis]
MKVRRATQEEGGGPDDEGGNRCHNYCRSAFRLPHPARHGWLARIGKNGRHGRPFG